MEKAKMHYFTLHHTNSNTSNPFFCLFVSTARINTKSQIPQLAPQTSKLTKENQLKCSEAPFKLKTN